MKRRDEVAVGIFVVLTLILGIMGTLWLARRGLARGYPVYTQFEWGAGLRNGQQVLLAGVQVGFVDRIELRRDGTLFVRLAIEPGYEIPEGTEASVITTTLFGDRAVALLPPRNFGDRFVASGDTIPAAAAAAGFDELLGRADTVSRALSDVAATFEIQMVQEGGLADLRRTIANTNQLMLQLNTIAAEQSRQLTATMASVRRTVAAIDSAQVDSTVRNLRSTTEGLSEMTQNLANMTARLDTVALGLQEGRGTAGQLLRDEALYNDLRALVIRVDSLTADIKANPRRYINVRVF